MVYVDPLVKWPTSIKCFRTGSCHMFADDIAELHAFAAKLGLKRAWFQNHRKLPHYDINGTRRAAALLLGAREITRKELGLRLKGGVA